MSYWKRRRVVATRIVMALVVLAMGAWWLVQTRARSAARDPTQPDVRPVNPQEMALGRAIYGANCAQCHGAQAEGNLDWRSQNPDGTYPPPPHDSSGHTWHHADGLLYRIVRDGGAVYETPGFKSAMPAFGNRLSTREITAVIDFLKSLWGPEERQFQAQGSREDPFPSESDGNRD